MIHTVFALHPLQYTSSEKAYMSVHFNVFGVQSDSGLCVDVSVWLYVFVFHSLVYAPSSDTQEEYL